MAYHVREKIAGLPGSVHHALICRVQNSVRPEVPELSFPQKNFLVDVVHDRDARRRIHFGHFIFHRLRTQLLPPAHQRLQFDHI
eukprot:2732874-Rhodomonas_salina.1